MTVKRSLQAKDKLQYFVARSRCRATDSLAKRFLQQGTNVMVRHGYDHITEYNIYNSLQSSWKPWTMGPSEDQTGGGAVHTTMSVTRCVSTYYNYTILYDLI